MASILDEMKATFSRSGNGLNRIIWINAIVFLIVSLIQVLTTLMSLNTAINFNIYAWTAIPAYLPSFITRPWTLITYMFMHSGFMHILFNMLWLYWMGQIFEEYLGNRKLVGTYLMGGIFGAVAFILAYNLFPFFASSLPGATAVGASAGVLAIVVGTATLLPDYTIRLFLFGDVKLKYIAMVSVLLDVLGTIGSNAGGSFAHLGGALFGFIYIKQLRQGRDLNQFVNSSLDFLSNVFSQNKKTNTRMKVYSQNQNHTAQSQSNGAGRPSQAEIDAILDKISEKGYDGLSKEEKEKLFKAGRS